MTMPTQQPITPPPGATPAVALPTADQMLTETSSAKFADPGATVTGVIMEVPVSQQCTDFNTKLPEFFPSGDPKMELVITLDVDAPDGIPVKVYAKYLMLKEIRAASRAAGAPIGVGGLLTVTYVGDGEAKAGRNAPKLYSASYTGPRTPAPEPQPDVQVAVQPTSPLVASQPMVQPPAQPVAQPPAQPVAQPVAQPAVAPTSPVPPPF